MPTGLALRLAGALRIHWYRSPNIWRLRRPPVPSFSLRAFARNVPAERVLVHHYRIDQDHSNSYALWLEMGSPQQVSREQYAILEKAGKLELLGAPEWVEVRNGALQLDFELPRQGVSLVQLEW